MADSIYPTIKLCTIYKITNLINGDFYIGQTIKTAPRRWMEHQADARRGSSGRFHNAVRKYGADSFMVEVLESEIPVSDADHRETSWIETLHPEYNRATGGKVNRGWHHSPESRQKISLANSGKKRNPTTCRKIAASKFGQILSPEHKKKISAGSTKVCWWRIITPSGDVVTVRGLREFCLSRGLHPANLGRGKTKGYTAVKLDSVHLNELTPP